MKHDWNDLIQRHLCGICTQVETEALLEALRSDDRVADLYLSHVNLDVALEGTAAAAALLEDLRAPSSPRSVSRMWRQTGLVRIVGMAACLTLALIAWKLVGLDGSWATVLQTEGGVEILRDGLPRPAVQGETLRSGDRIRVGAQGGGLLEVRRLGRVTLGPETRLHPAREPRMLELEGGFIEIEAEKQPADRPWRIRTAQAEAAVIGTKFTLAAADARTVLRVSEGMVRLTGLSSGKAESVEGGRRAFVNGDSPPAVAGSRTGSVLLLTSRTAPHADWDRFNRLIGDKLVGTRLWRLGFKVETRHFDEVQPADLQGRALVIVSIFDDGVGEPVLERLRLATAGMPLICLEPAGYATLGMAGGGSEAAYGFSSGASEVMILSGAHPMLKGLSIPPASWLRTLQGWGCPPPGGARVLAHLAGRPDRAVWFAYESGDVMAAPVNRAPARRTGLFLDPRAMSDPSSPVWQVFEASVDWSVSLETSP
jgi:ferric-dicitrate binding protein FerR (iron transport regulator)